MEEQRAERNRERERDGVIYLIDYVWLYYWACVSRFHGRSGRGRDKRRIMEDLKRPEKAEGWEGADGRAAFR